MDKKKFTPKTFRQYESALRGFIFQRVEDPQEAEEVFQETLVSALDSLPLFSGHSSFLTWLIGIAKHEIADSYRKKKIKTILFSRLPFLETLASQALGPEEIYEKEELQKQVRLALAGLDEGYRRVLRLKYYYGLSVKQIAESLNESFKTVESRLFRARQAFRKVFSSGLY